MTPEVIADLDRRGRAAGLLIAARFDPTAKQDPETGKENEAVFARHRWVRYRNFMAAFEDLSRRFARSRRASDNAAAARTEPLLDEMIARAEEIDLGYAAPKSAQSYYRDMTDALEKLALTMARRTRADKHSTFDVPREFGKRAPAGAGPRPKMRINLRPLIDYDPRAENSDLPGPFPPAVDEGPATGMSRSD
ncbi:MAG: hypothetical protein QOH32_4061 [Bradyrhizobium sp.]|jgi:hypothetical protein|nr:hypothetical protein [Bradyrhizobium sp.]